MRILHIINSLEIGGAQRLLSDLLPIQKKHKVDVDVLVFRDIDNKFSDIIKSAGINIISLHLVENNPLIIIRLRKIIKEYDLVHVHLFPSLYWVALSCIGLNKPKLVWTEHSTNNKRRSINFIRPIEKFIYNRYEKLISISLQTQNALQDWLQSNDNRFVVVNNGIQLSNFAFKPNPITNKSLIMVSRFVPAKDQETVIRAMRYIAEDVVLRFVGDGETLNHCKNVAKECGVYDRIEFMGSRSDVAELISESCIGIQSSHWEGFGLTAVEIMACGKPIIASDVEGLREVVDGAGLIFPVGDIETLANHVNNLFSDPKLYQEISNRCLLRAKDYDISYMAESYLNIYKSIL